MPFADVLCTGWWLGVREEFCIATILPSGVKVYIVQGNRGRRL